MNAAATVQALSEAIFLSWLQGLAIFLLCRFILAAVPNLSARWKYNLLYASLLLICSAFILTFWMCYVSISSFSGVTAQMFVSRTPPTQVFSLWKFQANVSYWIASMYLSGLFFQTLFLISGYYRLKVSIAESRFIAPALWLKRLEILKKSLKITRKVSLHFSDNLLIPFTAGCLKPVILFPVAAISQLSTDQVEAILLHELAHIKRNDYLLNIFQRVMEIILFFNPVTWMLSRQIRAEREFSCDDLVLRHIPEPMVYARALVLLEEQRLTVNQLVMALSGNKKSNLLTRIKKITNMKSQHSNLQQRFLAITGVLAIALSIAWILPSNSRHLQHQKDTIRKEQKNIPHAPPAPIPPAEIKDHTLPAPPKPMQPEPKLPKMPTVPAHPADTNELKKQLNSPEWKAKEKALEKAGEEISQYFNSPEWKNKLKAIEQSGAELEKKFNSPEWKAHVKELESLGEDLEKKFNSPEWKARVKEIESRGAQLEKQFSSPEWKEKMKKLEENSKELEKKFNSSEWKEKMKNLEAKSREMEKKTKELKMNNEKLKSEKN